MDLARPTGSHSQDIFRPRFQERRRARRGSCDHAATVRKRGSYAIQGRIADLTVDGCRITGVGPFPADGEMWVRLDGLESIASRAVWSRHGLAGVRFDHPLLPAVVARYLPAASRMALVGGYADLSDRTSAPDPVDDELSALARRAGIMRGIADLERGPLVISKRPTGGNLASLIRRRRASAAGPRDERR